MSVRMSVRDDYPAIAVLYDAWLTRRGAPQPEACRALDEVDRLRDDIEGYRFLVATLWRESHHVDPTHPMWSNRAARLIQTSLSEEAKR